MFFKAILRSFVLLNSAKPFWENCSHPQDLSFGHRIDIRSYSYWYVGWYATHRFLNFTFGNFTCLVPFGTDCISNMWPIQPLVLSRTRDLKFLSPPNVSNLFFNKKDRGHVSTVEYPCLKWICVNVWNFLYTLSVPNLSYCNA